MTTLERRLPGPLQVLSTPSQANFLRLGREVHFSRDDVLIRQGDASDDVVVLLEGRVRAVATAASGKEIMLALHGPGDFVGDVSVLDGGPRTATVTAMESVAAVRIVGTVFREALPEVPALTVALLQLAAHRLRRTNQRVVEQVADDVATRLARRLLEIAARQSALQDDGSLALTVELTQDQLATWIGATREATAKSLASLRRADIIDVGRGSLAIRDLDELRELAGF